MKHAPREIYEADPVDELKFDHDGMSETYAAYRCGLMGLSYLGAHTQGTNLAYMRGRAARQGRPIIDFPNSPPLTTRILAHA